MTYANKSSVNAYRTPAGPSVPTRKVVSKAWIWLVWIVPMWLWRYLPPWVGENVERAVYDGFTRHEWFEDQVRQFHDVQRPSEAKK